MRRFLAYLTLILLLVPLQSRAEIFLFKESSQSSPETARILETVSNKQRIFGRLREKGETDYYAFTTDEHTQIELILETPLADGDFRPHLVLFGPGLPAPKEDPTIQIGDSNGAIIAHAKDEREKRFDGILLTSFSIGPSLSVEAPRTATYGIAVRSTKGSTGRYVLHVGTKNTLQWDKIWQRMVGILKGMLRLY